MKSEEVLAIAEELNEFLETQNFTNLEVVRIKIHFNKNNSYQSSKTIKINQRIELIY